jgi:formate hydrogenlyase subunit 4
VTNFIIGIFNLLLVLLAAPLLDGVLRKVRARIHSRQGPPVLQTYFDLAKLMVKEDQAAVNNFIFAAAPVACLGSVLLASLLIPMGGVVPLGFGGDVVFLIYVLALSPIAICLGGMASGNPYAFIGVNREVMMLIVVEPVLAITLIASALRAHSLLLATSVQYIAQHPPSISLLICAIAFSLAVQLEVAKLPFDLTEAEQEIVEGPLIEYSGRKLALLKWSLYSKQIVFLTLFVEAFVPWPRMGILPLDILITLAKVALAAVVVEAVAQVFTRSKIKQTMGYFASVIAFALAGLVLAAMGL